ncbi:ABC transporter ATP-binding protein/permease [Patescibacteria group bacterium]|nr:ABC transporter ATP-binding protein/permease [Patescibacteria group bacterium]
MSNGETEHIFSLASLRAMLANSARLSKLVWKAKRGLVIALGIIFLIVSSAPFLQSGSRGLLINELVASAGSNSIHPRLFLLIAILILATLLPAVLYTVQNYLSRIFYFFLEEMFDVLALKKRAQLDVSKHENPAHQNLFNSITENGTWRIQNFTDRQWYIFQNVIEVVIASVILIFSQWWVFLIILLGTLPELLTELLYGKQVWNIHTGRAEIRRRYWNLNSHFTNLPSLIELKLFQGIPHFLSQIKGIFRAFHLEEERNEKRRLLHRFVVLCISQSVIAFALVYFTLQVVHGSLLIGTLTFILASIGDLRQSLSGLFTNLGRQYQDSLFVTDLFKLLDMRPDVSTPKHGIKLIQRRTPSIVFDNVSFSYPNKEEPVLKNISLTIEPGEKFALVGVNGAGKTTFVKLLCRFYDPTGGHILLDGIDMKKIDLERWYAQLGVIFQDYAHYNFPVKEAIAIGRTEIRPPDISRVKKAARMSSADAFIKQWEQGYDQMLGKEFSGGVEPSIGQWQKLALAKMFYRNPHIWILDEPTSSIDAEAEAKIFEQLEALPKDRTVILISHRFSTVRRADRIGVIENGMLAEYGTHEELLALDGGYARMFRLQAKGYA